MINRRNARTFMLRVAAALLALVALPGPARPELVVTIGGELAIGYIGPRVALVIGNAAYEHVPSIRNPVNDARAIASALGRLGYEVTKLENADNGTLRRGLLRFSREAEEAAVALVYYSGHGLAVDKRNFLLPVDAEMESGREAEFEAVSVDLVMRAIKRAPGLRLILLDTEVYPVASSRAMTPVDPIGVGLVQEDLSDDTLLAYAAEPGRVVFDAFGGAGDNSPYVNALLAHLEDPDLEVGLLFRKVRDVVLKETDSEQEPVVYGSLSGAEFYLGKLAAGKTFRDCPDCPEMTVVKAGLFIIRPPPDETGGNEDADLPTALTISKPFAVGKFEVTRGEFARFVEESGYTSQVSCETTDKAPSTDAQGAEQSWRNPGFDQTDRDPVVCVSLWDAQAYVHWLSRKTGRVYRLLSDDEWEYAARAGMDGPFQFGTTISTDQANYDGNHVYGSGAKGDYRKKTVPVGSFLANPFGLHDVHGNVSEWVEDCWYDDYPGERLDSSARTTGGDCTRRVLRGGAWNAAPQDLRFSVRKNGAVATRSDAVGFRVGRTLGR